MKLAVVLILTRILWTTEIAFSTVHAKTLLKPNCWLNDIFVKYILGSSANIYLLHLFMQGHSLKLYKDAKSLQYIK